MHTKPQESGTLFSAIGGNNMTARLAEKKGKIDAVLLKRREMWFKVPVLSVFADWTHFDLKELWGPCHVRGALRDARNEKEDTNGRNDKDVR